jgi:hypothetical protein
MDRNFAANAPDRPGKNAVWTSFRTAGKHETIDTQPGSTQPPRAGVGSLDPVRAAFWQAYRHLFPPHALAAQTPNGSVLISWSILDEPDARYPYAAPVMLRFDEDLLQVMLRADARQRARIAQKHEAVLREGLRGYDPFTRFPNARVIVIG